MKKLLIILIVLASFFAGQYYGSHDFYVGHDCHYEGDSLVVSTIPSLYSIDLKEGYYTEKKLCWAAFEMLYNYYHFKDYEGDPMNPYGHGNFWMDCIMETKAYSVADSIMGGDWEDFFAEP